MRMPNPPASNKMSESKADNMFSRVMSSERAMEGGRCLM